MIRLARKPLAAVAVAVLALQLGAVACSRSQQPRGWNGHTGSAGLLATSRGVVWSLAPSDLGGAVMRSSDNGSHWKIVLATRPIFFGLVASFFLGPDRAWAVHLRQHADGAGETTTVYGTADGGRTWWQSRPLPGDVSGCCTILTDQVYFADAMHGWLLGVGPSTTPSGPEQLIVLLWHTSDGGRNWTQLPARNLPLQNLPLSDLMSPCGLAAPPRIAFANAETGWITSGACGVGAARPQVWRTTDGGSHWTSTALPPPPGGWGHYWRYGTPSSAGGVDAGMPRVVSGRVPGVLIPVSTGASGLVIERSANLGRIWHIAARLTTGAVPINGDPADWFQVVNAHDWLVTAPGEVLETANAGRTWSTTRSAVGNSGPASFTSLSSGFIQGSGLVAALTTGDGGRTWTAQRSPNWHGTSTEQLGPAVTSVQLVTRRFAVASGAAGVQVSRDGGRDWSTSLPWPVSQVQFVNARTGFAVSAALGELLRTTDGGRTWQPVPQPAAGPAPAVQFWTASDGLAAAGTSVDLTVNGGVSWRPLRQPAGWSAPRGGAGVLVASGPASAMTCGASGGLWQVAWRHGRPGVLVSSDGGRTWQVALASQVFPRGGGPVFAGCSGDGAWILVSNLIQPECTGACGNVYPRTYDLLRSTDLGRSWLDVLQDPNWFNHPSPRPAVLVSVGALQPELFDPAQSVDFEPLAFGRAGSIWVTTQASDSGLGLGRSADDGTTWFGRGYQMPHPTSSVPLPQVPGGLPGVDQWLATSALNSETAWVLLKVISGTSFLYATSNGGATWHLIASFR